MKNTTTVGARGCAGACPREEGQRDRIERALSLEFMTVGWNVLEGAAALAAALCAGSVALFGFGVDSIVECASALVMIWRLSAERARRLDGERVRALEQRALHLVAVSLFLLAAYVTADAAWTLWTGDRPRFSAAGTAVLGLSALVMRSLARRKERVARELRSAAMSADVVQTRACCWLSLSALVGVGLNGLVGWWWADPLSAVVIAGCIARQGGRAWRGKPCC